MTIAEQIYTLVKTLPQEQAGEILQFAELIYAKHQNKNQPVSRSVSASTPSISLKDSLKRLYDLTQDFPAADPVAVIREGREELSDRGCF
jgi:hypothetical protein